MIRSAPNWEKFRTRFLPQYPQPTTATCGVAGLPCSAVPGPPVSTSVVPITALSVRTTYFLQRPGFPTLHEGLQPLFPTPVLSPKPNGQADGHSHEQTASDNYPTHSP